MEIRSGPGCAYAEAERPSTGGGKRSRAPGEETGSGQDSGLGSARHAFATSDCETTVVKQFPDDAMCLFALPSDMLSVIAGALSLRESAHLAVLCTIAQAFPWAPELGRPTISKMGAARSGKAILAAIQDPTTIRPDWQSSLYVSFARKVQYMELRDHTVLIEAWETRRAALDTNAAAMSHPDAPSHVGALRWFFMQPSHRNAMCMWDGTRQKRFRKYATYVLAPAPFPGPSLIRILEGMSPLYRRTRAYNQMVSTVALKIDVHGGGRPRVSMVLAIDIAIAMYDIWNNMSNLSASVGDLFGLSEDEVRRYIDPILAEHIAEKMISIGDMIVSEPCNRWRSSDSAFAHLILDRHNQKIVSDALHFGTPLHVLGDADVVGSTGDAAQRRMQDYMQKVIARGGTPFRGDAEMARRFEDVLRAIPLCTVETILPLCVSVDILLPYHVAALLMPRLARQLSVLDKHPCYQRTGRIDRDGVFDYFVAWRDRITRWCIAPGDVGLAALAYAAPLRALAGFSDEKRLREKAIEAAEQAFAALPPHVWAELLDSIVKWSTGLHPILEKKRNAEVLGTFICDPHAAVDDTMVDLISAIIRQAPYVWDSVPDIDDGEASRVERFAERFHLCTAQTAALRDDILASLSQRVLDGECTVHEGMQGAGLSHDTAAIQMLENAIWHRALVVAEEREDWEDTVRHHTRGSANLRNQAAIYIAGTTGAPMLETV